MNLYIWAANDKIELTKKNYISWLPSTIVLLK